MSKMASLILEDGTTFKGLLFGANVSVSGEVGESGRFSTILISHASFIDPIGAVASRTMLQTDSVLWFNSLHLRFAQMCAYLDVQRQNSDN